MSGRAERAKESGHAPVDGIRMADVLIAGAGPTGLSAALFLAERGIRPGIIDREPGPSRHSRAFAVNARSLDLLEGTAVAGRLLDEGRRMRAVNLWRGGRRIARVDLTRVDPDAFMLIHPQAATETLLSEALAERGIAVRRGVALEDVELRGDRARVALRGEDGEPAVEDVDVLLGADGAHSAVRAALGIGFTGPAYEERWWLVDLLLDTPLPRDEGHAFLLDDGAMLVLRLENDLWRVAGNVAGRLERLPADTEPGRIEWESEFGIAHRVADRLRAGPAFLAGDAAHVHSPLGGRGMNLGIEDAWVFAGLLAEGRLDAYEELRRPVVRKVVRQVERLTEVPRGRSPVARLARALAPALGPLLGLASPLLGRWVLGLDHEARLA